MKFEPRHQKLGGRQIGTPNRSTAVREKLEEMGFDPIELIATIAMDESIETSIRLNAAKELAQYVAPKLRSTAVSLSNEQTSDYSELSSDQINDRIAYLLAKHNMRLAASGCDPIAETTLAEERGPNV